MKVTGLAEAKHSTTHSGYRVGGAIFLPADERCNSPDRWEMVNNDRIDDILSDPRSVLAGDKDTIELELENRHPCLIDGATYIEWYEGELSYMVEKTKFDYYTHKHIPVWQKRKDDFQGWILLDTPRVISPTVTQLIAITTKHGPVLINHDAIKLSDLKEQGFTVSKRRFDMFQVNYSPRGVKTTAKNRKKREYENRMNKSFPEECLKTIYAVILSKFRSQSAYRFLTGHEYPPDTCEFDDIRQIVEVWHKLFPKDYSWRTCHYTYSFTGRRNRRRTYRQMGSTYMGLGAAITKCLQYLHGREDKIKKIAEKRKEHQAIYEEALKKASEQPTEEERLELLYLERMYKSMEPPPDMAWFCRWLRREAKALKIEIPKKPVPPKPAKRKPKRGKRKAKNAVVASKAAK